MERRTMKTFKQFVFEMATPSDAIKSKTYYHGTSSRAAALGIAEHGILPPEAPKKSGDLTPVAGKVYITPHIHYAQIYSLGGDIAGSNCKMSHHQHEDYGYVFSVHGSKLKDVQPDEDSVGEMVNNGSPIWLQHMARNHLHPTTFKKIKDGEYSKFASGGKQLVRKMTDTQKSDIINAGAHVAHTGSLKPDSVYRIHKDKIPLLKRDGSNFFDHAEKIDIKDI
jgi:hypothetical protein